MRLGARFARRASTGHAGAWPDAAQELLLRACLCEGEAALAAWNAWRAHSDLDQLDAGSYRLIPLLYGNLIRSGVAPEELACYRGIHRKSWYQNQLLLQRAAPSLARLQDAGHEVILLKGAALAWSVYDDAGQRPMDDVDFLVRTEEADAALDLLLRCGFAPLYDLSREELARQRTIRHSWNLSAPDGLGVPLDFHWHLLAQSVHPGADDAFWEAAVPLRWGPLQLATLDPTDHLLQLCLHGLEPNPLPPIRWIADAAMLLRRSAGAVDWRRLVEQARRRRVALVLGRALDYLRRRIDVGVPEEVARELLAAASTSWERGELRSCAGGRPFAAATLRYVHRYRRLRAQSPHWIAKPPLLSYLRYLERFWRLERARDIPLFVARKALERLAGGPAVRTGRGHAAA